MNLEGVYNMALKNLNIPISAPTDMAVARDRLLQTSIRMPESVLNLGFCLEMLKPSFLHQTIYLAGKCSGAFRLDFWEKIPCVDFVSSAGTKHSEHNWGTAWYEWGNPQYTEFIEEYFIDELGRSDMLVAFLDEPTSYGSIAEIAWAAAKGKRCLVYLPSEESETREVRYRHTGRRDEEGFGNDFWDTYWFVCHMPNVEVRRVETLDKAVLNFKSHCLECDKDCGKTTRSVASAIKQCQSPIEQWLCLGLFGNDLADGLYVQSSIRLSGFTTHPDFVYGKYSDDIPKVAIYCDGFSFQLRSEALSRDRHIDRELQREGWTVLRFMGTELWNDLEGCIETVRDTLNK